MTKANQTVAAVAGRWSEVDVPWPQRWRDSGKRMCHRGDSAIGNPWFIAIQRTGDCGVGLRL